MLSRHLDVPSIRQILVKNLEKKSWQFFFLATDYTHFLGINLKNLTLIEKSEIGSAVIAKRKLKRKNDINEYF